MAPKKVKIRTPLPSETVLRMLHEMIDEHDLRATPLAPSEVLAVTDAITLITAGEAGARLTRRDLNVILTHFSIAHRLQRSEADNEDRKVIEKLMRLRGGTDEETPRTVGINPATGCLEETETAPEPRGGGNPQFFAALREYVGWQVECALENGGGKVHGVLQQVLPGFLLVDLKTRADQHEAVALVPTRRMQTIEFRPLSKGRRKLRGDE